MDIDPVIISIPIYFLLIGIELIIQFFAKRKIYRLNDAITNISCGITQQVFGAFFKVIAIAAYQYVFEYWSITEIPTTWWSIILLILGVDFCYYWAHRMSHEINLFWGGHVVHHQSEDFNFSVALRQGSFQVIWTFWFHLPLAFIGFDTISFLLILAFNTVYQFWIHTETIGKLPRPIEFVFNTPSHHRVHHGRDPKYIDKNHAGSLILWDRIFGTFQEEEEQPTYGITTPVNTWNPVWANFKHYYEMARQIIQVPGLANKMKVIFYKPGWKPGWNPGQAPVKPKEQQKTIETLHQKYDEHPAQKIGIYVLAQFAVVIILTSLFLFQLNNLEVSLKALFSAYIIWSVWQLGVLIENKSKWIFLEYLRVLSLPVLLFFLFSEMISLVILVIFAIVCLVWCFFATGNRMTLST